MGLKWQAYGLLGFDEWKFGIVLGNGEPAHQMEERFMMIEELMQEEFEAGRAEGKTEGERNSLTTAVLDILEIRNIFLYKKIESGYVSLYNSNRLAMIKAAI